jgi:hypothetical protein
MEKFWIVYGVKNSGNFFRHKTQAAAEDAAKRAAFADRDNEFVIMEAVGVAKHPVPNIEIEKLK